jgi:hypothetical protein
VPGDTARCCHRWPPPLAAAVAACLRSYASAGGDGELTGESQRSFRLAPRHHRFDFGNRLRGGHAGRHKIEMLAAHHDVESRLIANARAV